MTEQPPAETSIISFVAGSEGMWRIDGILAPKGETLPRAARLAVVEGEGVEGAGGRWALRGTSGPTSYANEDEVDALAAKQEPLGRPEARCAALIAVRKSPAWWAMTHDERRAVIEERSHHIAVGLEYLPSIARRLHYSHELSEPFDFLTWFEYAPDDQEAFDELVGRLRKTEEWSFVEREVDVRVTR
ncbi:MAG: chlorite dismutase family protein [Actinomycetota bacterium]|nr:chlorite dismutase family protein [Actinomycetota bacterium]